MPVDRTIVGNVASDLKGELEQRFGDNESANIRAVFLVVAVDHLDEEQGPSTEVRYGVSEGMPKHEGIGLLEYVKGQLY